MSAGFDPSGSEDNRFGEDVSTDTESIAATIKTVSSGVITQPEAPNPEAHLQIDSELSTDDDFLFEDGDSAFGPDTPPLSSSTSLVSSIENYQYENGRRYHAYRQGQYLLPNDEPEQDRLDLLHHIYRLILDGMLFRAPIARHPQRVLDMGTGTGIWAIDFADEFPSAVVTGNDLSPIQPCWVPPNCKFIVDDLESPWLYNRNEPFDFIHGRAIAGSIKDWPRLYRQTYAHLKPGGWVEMQEFEGVLRSDDDPELNNAPMIRKWQGLVDEATTEVGQQLNVAGEQQQLMKDAGFINVRDDVYKVPCGRWPQDPRLKNLGIYQREHVIDCVEPFTLAIFKRILKWSDEETQVLMAKVKGEFRNNKNRLYTNFHFVYGKKPV